VRKDLTQVEEDILPHLYAGQLSFEKGAAERSNLLHPAQQFVILRRNSDTNNA
jgi:hypothetical protein